MSGSSVARDIDMEFRMKKAYTCPKCIFYDKKLKKCKESRCQNTKWNKTL